MRSFRLFWFAFLSSFAFNACSDDAEIFTNTIDAAEFTLRTPEDWKLIEYTGIDSYVGEIAGHRDTIYFDCSFWTFGRLDNITVDAGTIFFKKMTIHGDSAIVYKRKVIQGSLEWIELSAYVESSGRAKLNHLYVISPSSPENEKLLVEVFKTHQFK